MDREFERRWVRLEAKINICLRALGWIAAFVCGLGVFYLTRISGWEDSAKYAGFVAAFLGMGLIEWEVKRIEKMFPWEDED